ncbi:MAG: hypothetical protein HUJ97_10320, partial [Bacteroidales bacterium]|nr:hypothetical protein [Bacteroidales bacterium]
TFTGKELDDETQLSNHGARLLDPMLGLWTSVDPARQFFNSYAYGPANPINGYDSDGEIWRTIGKPYYTNVAENFFYNATAVLEMGSTVMGKTIYAPNINNLQDIRVRNVVQQWEYDPNASAEENARHNYHAKRVIQQVKVDKTMEIDDFMRRRNETTIPLYNTQEKMGWMPFVFDEEPLEMNDFPVDENAYEPNGNVEAGDVLECDNCSL